MNRFSLQQEKRRKVTQAFYNRDAFIVVVIIFHSMRSVRAPMIIIALSVTAVSLIFPFYTYSISALRSNPCPKYCDGCCIPRPKNATGLTAIAPINNNNQKALVRDNGPTPPPCPDKGPIPPNCTLKPKF